MPKFFAGLFLNGLIISLLICACVQNLQVCFYCFQVMSLGPILPC